MFLAAVVQLQSTSDVQGNLAKAEALIARAANAGASLVLTPEATNYLGPHDRKVALAEPLDGPTVSRLSSVARAHGIHLVVGSINEVGPDPGRCYNTSVVLGPDGSLLGHYRKLHLFDVDVDGGVRFQESATIAAGDAVVTVPTPLGTLGLSICYDLRFPELFRALSDAGADLLCVPAAFTLMTGKDHWEALLRARAIENQAYVFAPGQHGDHDDAGLRRSYGHSLIVDPWGHVVARASDGPGLAFAEVDLSRAQDLRRRMPIRQHRRLPLRGERA